MKEAITIKYKGEIYTEEDLDVIYEIVAENYIPKQNNLDDISIDPKEELTEENLKELYAWKTKMKASSWKSQQRSLRKKGKLEQYKIDSLNKLGMVWNQKEDEWEKKYLLFRKIGLCDELEEWVKEQRKLFDSKEISDENLYRLNAANFPFKPSKKEHFPFTYNSINHLKEKLRKKKRRIELKLINNPPKKLTEKHKEIIKNASPKKQKVKQNESQREVNSFYNRKYNYCSNSYLKNLSETETLDKLSQIDKGESLYNGRLKDFLDNESNKFKSKGRKTPYWVSKFYSDVNDKKLGSDEIYLELSSFITPKFNPIVRKKACQYMLKHISNINLNKFKSFKEIDYLMSAYKKEKKIDKLLSLKKHIDKYPLLFELYNDKIEQVLMKL